MSLQQIIIYKFQIFSKMVSSLIAALCSISISRIYIIKLDIWNQLLWLCLVEQRLLYSTKVLISYLLVIQVIDSRQWSLHLRCTAKSLKQRDGTGQIQCLANVWSPGHCKTQNCLKPATLTTVCRHASVIYNDKNVLLLTSKG